MHIDIIPIGNSKGIRIPKVLLEQCGFRENADLSVADGKIILSPITSPREGWEETFKDADAGEERLMGDFSNEFDESEWTW